MLKTSLRLRKTKVTFMFQFFKSNLRSNINTIRTTVLRRACRLRKFRNILAMAFLKFLSSSMAIKWMCIKTIKLRMTNRRLLTWSYSEDETRNRIEVTESKHSNQRRLSERWPPTSTILKGTFLISKLYSCIPLVGLLARRMSCWLGR